MADTVRRALLQLADLRRGRRRGVGCPGDVSLDPVALCPPRSSTVAGSLVVEPRLSPALLSLWPFLLPAQDAMAWLALGPVRETGQASTTGSADLPPGRSSLP